MSPLYAVRRRTRADSFRPVNTPLRHAVILRAEPSKTFGKPRDFPKGLRDSLRGTRLEIAAA